MSIRVAVLGATGRMGRLVVRQVLDAQDLELAAALTHAASSGRGIDAGTLVGRAPCGLTVGILEAPLDADVVVDFALPAGLLDALPHLGGVAIVSGTTGLSAEQHEAVLAHDAPVLLAANFSTGVNVLEALVAAAAAALPDFDVEIVEAHHRRKVDAPSGTALALASRAAEARGQQLDHLRDDGRSGAVGPRAPGRIGLHALRGGTVTGHHAVWLAGESERLQLVHEAEDRQVFATGALRAARWIAGQAVGTYTMHDVLGLSAMLKSPPDATV